MHFVAKPFRSTVEASASGISQLRKWFWHTSATSQHSDINFAAAKLTAKLLRKWQVAAKLAFCCETNKLTPGLPFFLFIPVKSAAKRVSKIRAPFSQPLRLLQATPSVSPVVFSVSAGQRSIAQNGTNARAKSSSLRTAKGVCERSQVQVLFQNLLQSLRRRDQTSPVKPAPPKPPARRYLTRSGGQPLKKKPGAVTGSLANSLTEATPIPSPVPSPAPQEKAQEPQAPIPEPQIAAEAPLEEVIRRPMLPAPNRRKLDCRTRAFHSELCFDLAAFRVRPELAQSFQLLRRYHMEHLLAPRDFFYPRVVTDFYQTMTTKEPTQFDNFKAWTNPTELEMVSTLSRGAANRHTSLDPKKGSSLEALYKMSEGFFFGPHHLIMAALLYFEEKVHKKKLQRADCIPLLFPRLLCQVLEHLGYPSEPQQERKRICREPFTLDKWNNMTAYKIDQPGQPQPAARRASPRHPPEGITLATPAIPRAPPAAPAPSQPSTSAEPRMAIPISEYRELCRALETLTASQSNLAQELAAIKACQEQMLASQAQQAAILRQLQVHFDLPQAVEPPLRLHQSHTLSLQSLSSRARSPADPPTEEADPSA
ncbi:hypothetical protein CK203_065399 [Vitis vinifera]|uniref:Uncharacterized protein n=1 Tax=Vitis vinifera TaxID=29760 RepID=A0A438FNS3_VITVI|nr:hypothetical protein CK203_065399 [Vitis vinifera]